MKSIFASPVTTTVLLAVIAFLQLLLVIRRAQEPPASPPASAAGARMPNPHLTGEIPLDAPLGPGGDPAAVSAGAGKSDNMMYAALNCPDDPALTLADPACRGGAADERRKAVDEIAAAGIPVGKMFDRIVEKYGEAALTREAVGIRRMRRTSPGPQ